MIRVNRARVDVVSIAFRELGLEPVLSIEEELDPQYFAMQRIASRLGRGVAAVYGILTAIVSYKLSMPGEEWWLCLAEYIEANVRRDGVYSVDVIANDVIAFLDWCKGSIIARDAKKRRVLKALMGARGVLDEILSNPDVVFKKPLWITDNLAKALGAEPWKKTIVFSLKMAYYAVRRPGSFKPLNAIIPLPVDLRVACLTYTSGIVDAGSYREIQAKQKPAQEAWNLVSRKSGIPPMHLDTILWLGGKFIREHPQMEARRKIRDMLSKVANASTASKIASELTWRECR